MRRHIEIRRLQHLDRLRYQTIVENDRAENCFFSFGTAGKRFLEDCVADRFRGRHCFWFGKKNKAARSIRMGIFSCGANYTTGVARRGRDRVALFASLAQREIFYSLASAASVCSGAEA